MWIHQAAYLPDIEFAAGPRQIPKAVLEWRKTACCNGCGLQIHPDVKLEARGGKAYHPSCARTFDAEARVRAAVTAQRTIGRLVGIAVPFGQRCLMPPGEGPHSGRSEQFACGAFTDSIARGDVHLRIGHQARVPGRLELFETPTDLRFRCHIFDTPIGRNAFERVARGEARGASIGFRVMPEHERVTRDQTLLVTKADLTEVSIVFDGWPKWYGTVVQVEP